MQDKFETREIGVYTRSDSVSYFLQRKYHPNQAVTYFSNEKKNPAKHLCMLNWHTELSVDEQKRHFDPSRKMLHA